ncbi:MAG TPA: S8 family serine peptidase [Steroidobacteraceae bacterium]|nr:S8 family serine peptidase [Steroidobacteraceae bacterium]
MRFLKSMIAVAVAMAAAVGVIHAQIRLPLSLPSVPLHPVAQSLDAAQSGRLDAASEWRHRQIARLLRENARLIETDPNGDPILRSEIIAVVMDDEALAQALERGFVLARESFVGDIHLRVLKAPAGLATRNALRDLRAADARGVYDYNHIYLGVGVTAPDPSASAALPASWSAQPASSAAASPSPAAQSPPGARVRVGLLDTGVDATHPVFHESLIHSWGCGAAQVPASHGTAVASLLISRGATELFAADVYCGSPAGGAVDAIVTALGWLSAQQVAVINVSLVGPKNALLERVVATLVARGHLIVAAVGNDGPAAPPLYPAAYPGVVGVTAVDAHRHVLIEAERGPQVMFAAEGADLTAASVDHRYAAVRGTSFAAPTVAALLADSFPALDREAALAAIDALARSAMHSGSGGRDLTYGFGIVGGR